MDIPFVSWKVVFKSQIPERSYSIRNVDPEFQPQGKLEAEAKIMFYQQEL